MLNVERFRKKPRLRAPRQPETQLYKAGALSALRFIVLLVVPSLMGEVPMQLPVVVGVRRVRGRVLDEQAAREIELLLLDGIEAEALRNLEHQRELRHDEDDAVR